MTRVGNTNNYSPFVKEPLFKETNVCELSFHASNKASTLIPHICKLSVLVLNCQSIVPKKADLNCLIETTNPDIILLHQKHG